MNQNSSTRILKEICATYFAEPIYTNLQCGKKSSNKTCQFEVKFHLNGSNIKAIASGKSKNEAKENSAKMALDEISKLKLCPDKLLVDEENPIYEDDPILPIQIAKFLSEKDDFLTGPEIEILLQQVENSNLGDLYNVHEHPFAARGKEICVNAARILANSEINPETKVKQALQILDIAYEIRECKRPKHVKKLNNSDYIHVFVITQIEPKLQIAEYTLENLYRKVCDYLLVYLS